MGGQVDLHRNLEALIPHYFNDHSRCGEWRSKKTLPLREIRYLGFRNESALNGEKLKSELNSVIKHYLTEDFCEKLATEGDTNMCESVHSVLRTRNPKDIHFGGSQRHAYGVASAVCHINAGNVSTIMVLQKAGVRVHKSSHF